MMPHTNWIPGLIVLVTGLVIAIGWVLFARRKGALAGAPVDETLANLDKRAQDLIEQLREMQQDRHLLSDEQFAAEKARLEKAAADALRARDAYKAGKAAEVASGSAPVAAPAAKGGFFAQHPQLTGAMWGGGVVLFFVALGLLLSQSAKPRGQDGVLTGVDPAAQAGMTQQGGEDAQAQNGPQAPDPQLEQAIAEVKAHPENLDLAAEVSHALIRNQDFATASDIVNRSLALDPFNPELRVHRAFLKAANGDEEAGAAELERLANTYPGASESLLLLGMMSLTSEQPAKALEYLERYAAEVPADQFPPHLAQGIIALRQQVNGGGQQ